VVTGVLIFLSAHIAVDEPADLLDARPQCFVASTIRADGLDLRQINREAAARYADLGRLVSNLDLPSCYLNVTTG
jgi:hypothetical protein